MSEDQFARLCQYVEKRFNEMDAKLEEARHDRADIRATLAKLSAKETGIKLGMSL